MGLRIEVVPLGVEVRGRTIILEFFGRMWFVDVGFQVHRHRFRREINGDVILF